MTRNRFMLVIGVLVVASMILSACGPGETPGTEVPVVPTEAPTAEPTTRTGAWVDQIVFTGIEQGEAAVTQLKPERLTSTPIAFPTRFSLRPSKMTRT